MEEIDGDIKTDEISEESAATDSEPTRATSVNAASWSNLKSYGEDSNANYDIYLTSPITVDKTVLIFGNSATIIGTPDNYITGGNSGRIPFQSTGSLNITFINVTFKDMSASILMQLATSGHNRIINCTFDNIHTYAFQSSVIYNHGGWMTITGSNFTNCNNSYGTITNHLTYDSVFMDIKDCRFENNIGRYEPGAINNCGILNVTDCTFINNRAGQWAGAIHTHSNAYTRIVGSNFTDNVAGTNGGALFSYSKLEVINSTFTGNNATDNGGAICGYSYGSIYNITVDSCNFINNRVSNGPGGAIRAINLGYLTVAYSNFTNNYASNGQAISGITETIDYCNCENCYCDDCPNCENCTHYISNESANLKIYNNTFINHTGSSDTVTISGNDYVFENNTFINSVQNTNYVYSINPQSTLNHINNLPKKLLASYSDDSKLGDEKVVSTDMELFNACDNAEEGDIIYLESATFTRNMQALYSITIIGLNREQTIYTGSLIYDYDEWMDNNYPTITLKNMTFKSPILNLVGNKVFINCTFISPIIKTNEKIYDTWKSTHNADHLTESFAMTFTDCEFKDYNIEGGLLEAFSFSQINFNNCVFDNIIANSIVNNTGGFILQDEINFNGCTFNNVNVKGIADVPTGTNLEERVHIEDCTGVEGTMFNDGDRDFINSTGSRTATVLTAEVDADDNLVITLKEDNGNAVAGAQVLISVNGGEAALFELGDDGTLTKPLSDFASTTGPINIVVTFEKTNDYEGATQTVDYVIRIATSINAEDLTTETNVAKDLTVTLVDNNNNPLAGKEIIVSINNTNTTVTTDDNGAFVIPVNYDAAGVYEYTISFAGDETTYKGTSKVVTVTVKESEPAPPVKVATKLTAPKVSATYNAAKNLVITLTDKDGKLLANKQITVKVGSISKTLTTNAKGQASLNVATLVPKTYTATIKFAGDSDYTASSVSPKVVVSKAKPKITAKAKTFKVKTKVKKFTATLKNNKGKAMKKVKLTIKVGKKTFKATTNSKGKATFKIKMTKKGKYNAKIKFAGNKYYKALSKKVKITIK